MAHRFGPYTPYGAEGIEAYLRRFASFLETKQIKRPSPLLSDSDALAVAAHAEALTTYNASRKAWLLAVIGPDTYGILDDLCGAQNPEDKTGSELEKLLITHFRPACNVNTEREKFYKRTQQANESVSEFAVALSHLAKTCEFGSFLDSALQTQFINNLKSPKIKERVAEGKDTYSELIQDAVKLEAIHAQIEPCAVHFVKKTNYSAKGKRQFSQTFKKKAPDNKNEQASGQTISGSKWISKIRCYNCNNYGHFARDCKKPKKEKKKKDVKLIETSASDSPLDLYRVEGARRGNKFPERLVVPVSINGTTIQMEVDTGAKASIIGRPVYEKHFQGFPLRPTRQLIWGDPLPMLGEFPVHVTFQGREADTTLVVVDKDFPSLYGLPWMQYIRPNFDELIPEVLMVSTPPITATEQLLAELKPKYPHVFGPIPNPILGFEVPLRLKIETEPVFFGPRVIAIPLRRGTQEALQRMVEEDLIEPCPPGPWGTPIVPIPKSSGEVRICGDYSVTLNPHLEVSGRALPLIDDLSVVNGKWFCILDMNQAYLQLQLTPEASELSKINTPFGSFKWKRMPFGISSAPGIYQEVISSILAGIENIFIYLDDILLWGQTREECLTNLHKVLARLDKYHVTLNVRKSEFLVQSVRYLGFLLDERGSRPDPDRMNELLNKPPPQDHNQLQSFIGMITFFHKYGRDLATVLHPLYVLKTSSKWYWTEREQNAYDTALKLLSTQILVPYSLDRPLRLTADASPVGAGCVLSHVTEEGKEEPVAFASKTFSSTELNYPVHEREAAALIFGLKKFHKYLCYREFEIVTDNKPLAAIFKEKSHSRTFAAARLQRWGLLLSAYRYKIVHRRSRQIPHADFLSRFPSPDQTPVESEVYYTSYVENGVLSAREVATETMADPLLRRVLGYVRDGWPDESSEELEPFKRRYLELSTEGGCILWNCRVIVPPVLRPGVLELLHDAHPGGSRMKTLARSYVWWPGMDRELDQLVKNCMTCQVLHAGTPHEALVPWSWPTRRWQRVSMDYGQCQGQHFLILQDGHSKWPEVKLVPNLDASTLIEVLRTLFATWGLPEEMVSDNGQPYSSAELAEFFKANGVVHTFSPTYHPQSNGLVERGVRTLKEGLLKQLVDPTTSGRTLQHMIDAWCFAYRNTPHTTTGVSPAELFLGRRPRTLLSLLQPGQLLKRKIKDAQEERKTVERAKVTPYQPGDLVWVRNVRHRRLKWSPGVVECAVSSVSYEVLVSGRVRQVSSSHLRRRSVAAEDIEGDPLAVDPSGVESLPTASSQLGSGPQPLPKMPAVASASPSGLADATEGSAEPVTMSSSTCPATSGLFPSPSTSANVPAPLGTPSSPRGGFSPDHQPTLGFPSNGSPAQSPATPAHSVITRRGRRVVPPRRFIDYVVQ